MAIPGDLYISVDFGSSPTKDDGTRPYTGTNPQWNNFSMWLDGGPNQTQTSVGAPTTVKVRVSNKGTSPVSAVKVDAYVMNPFVGATKPNQAIQRLTGTVPSVAPGSGSTSPTDAHVVTCEIQDPVHGPIPWTPTPAELSSTVNGQGHLCVIANVFADGDGHQLPDAEDFQVVNDQHQGQRNITLLPMAPRSGHSFEFMIMPALEEGDTRVAIEAVDREIAIGAGERWLLRSHRDISRDREKRGLVLHHNGEQFPLFLSDTDLRTRLFVEDEGFGGRLPAFGEPLRARILLDMSEEERLGAMHVFDIVQRDRKERVLGALRVLTVITG